MTRAELRRNIRLRLGETESQVREPLLLDEAISLAADDVARRTDCYQTYETSDIDGSPTVQSSFCMPPNIYKIKSVKVVNEDDTVTLFVHNRREIVTRKWMDTTQGNWQTEPLDTGEARFAVVERPYLWLWPYPDYDKTDGLTVYGYATPSGLWSADDDECPLPDYAHAAVEWRACMIRAIQFMDDKANQLKYPIFEREYESAVGMVAILIAQEVSSASPKVGAR